MTQYARKLGQQPGIQLNPIAEAISTIDAGVVAPHCGYAATWHETSKFVAHKYD
jgi:hypothetical protein